MSTLKIVCNAQASFVYILFCIYTPSVPISIIKDDVNKISGSSHIKLKIMFNVLI